MPTSQSNPDNTPQHSGSPEKKCPTANMSGSGVGHENERKKVDIVNL